MANLDAVRSIYRLRKIFYVSRLTEFWVLGTVSDGPVFWTVPQKAARTGVITVIWALATCGSWCQLCGGVWQDSLFRFGGLRADWPAFRLLSGWGGVSLVFLIVFSLKFRLVKKRIIWNLLWYHLGKLPQFIVGLTVNCKFLAVKTFIFAICAQFLSCLQAMAFADDVEIIVRDPAYYHAGHRRFIEETLVMALDKVGVTAHLVYAKTDFSRKRMLQELIKGENLQVVSHAPTAGWEEKLITIRIPLHKGLQGYRLFAINKKDADTLAAVETLEQLKQLPTGSGLQWASTEALQTSGFRVITAEGLGSLYEMLRLGRIVTFGRGVFEIFNEIGDYDRGRGDLVVEQTLCLFVPLPVYFFVSPQYPELARQIENGLKLMIADGTFEAHFRKYHLEAVMRARLDQRKVFTIANPNLSALTPLDEPSYWFDPKDYRSEEADEQTQ